MAGEYLTKVSGRDCFWGCYFARTAKENTEAEIVKEEQELWQILEEIL